MTEWQTESGQMVRFNGLVESKHIFNISISPVWTAPSQKSHDKSHFVVNQWLKKPPEYEPLNNKFRLITNTVTHKRHRDK